MIYRPYSPLVSRAVLTSAIQIWSLHKTSVHQRTHTGQLLQAFLKKQLRIKSNILRISELYKLADLLKIDSIFQDVEVTGMFNKINMLFVKKRKEKRVGQNIVHKKLFQYGLYDPLPRCRQVSVIFSESFLEYPKRSKGQLLNKEIIN